MKCDPLACPGNAKQDGKCSNGEAPVKFTAQQIVDVGAILCDSSQPLKRRFRALFTLQNIGGDAAVQQICRAFNDSSALLRHELAYCLGQMGEVSAIGRLSDVLTDLQEDAMVRHEAGEALGAIGDPVSLPLLERMSGDSVTEVAETCQLAVQRIRWLQQKKNSGDDDGGQEQLSANPYKSVDPAPPSASAEGCQVKSTADVSLLREQLLDAKLPLWQRYRSMFALRNCGTELCVRALADALSCGVAEVSTNTSSGDALFRHEVAYVLGQMAHPAATDQLTARLADKSENYMVRHECAEALGAIATDHCMSILRHYADDRCRVVRESCQVALDMGEYEQDTSCFQYADTLTQTGVA